MLKPIQKHQPVLVAEVLDYLRPTAGDSLLDLTAGYGGHAKAIIEATGAPTAATLVDRDAQAIAALQTMFGSNGPKIIKQSFLAASQQLAKQGRRFAMVLADLGVSSPQLDEPQRGFSFSRPAPLDMRLDQTQKLTAATIVNQAAEADIVEVLSRYGQEPKARRIAKLIVQQRPLNSTEQLAAIAKQAWPGRSRRHPATRTFQALRIAVNDELSQLADSLPLWLELLSAGGRLVIISYHSLEDGLVKACLAEHSGRRYDAQLQLLTKKPLTPRPIEIATNPRSRSAKLRAAVKINKERIER